MMVSWKVMRQQRRHHAGDSMVKGQIARWGTWPVLMHADRWSEGWWMHFPLLRLAVLPHSHDVDARPVVTTSLVTCKAHPAAAGDDDDGAVAAASDGLMIQDGQASMSPGVAP